MRYLLIAFARKQNGQIDEMVSVAKKVNSTDISKANIVVDFAKKKLLKCVIEGKPHDSTYELIREYYHKIYPTLIEQLEKEGPIEG